MLCLKFETENAPDASLSINFQKFPRGSMPPNPPRLSPSSSFCPHSQKSSSYAYVTYITLGQNHLNTGIVNCLNLNWVYHTKRLEHVCTCYYQFPSIVELLKSSLSKKDPLKSHALPVQRLPTLSLSPTTIITTMASRTCDQSLQTGYDSSGENTSWKD